MEGSALLLPLPVKGLGLHLPRAQYPQQWKIIGTFSIPALLNLFARAFSLLLIPKNASQGCSLPRRRHHAMPPRLLLGGVVVDKTVLSITAAVLISTAVHYVSSRWSELVSEAICWAVLAVLFPLHDRFHQLVSRYEILPPQTTDPPRREHGSPSYSWAAAAAITAISCYKSELGAIQLLVSTCLISESFQYRFSSTERGTYHQSQSQPALIPLYLIVEAYLGSASESWGFKGPWWHPSRLRSSILGSIGAAYVTIGAVSTDHADATLFLSVLPTLAMLAVYVGLMLDVVRIDRASQSSEPGSPRIAGYRVSFPTSTAILLILAIAAQTLYYGLPPTSLILITVLLGLMKACGWYLIAKVVCIVPQPKRRSNADRPLSQAEETTWRIGPAIITCGVVFCASMSRGDLNSTAALLLSSCLLQISQIDAMLPKNAAGGRLIWLLLLAPLGGYLHNTYEGRVAMSRVQAISAHPVEALIQEARRNFSRLTERQSQNYTAACAEYERRYGMKPPPGFEQWHEFATSNQSPIIDDFNTIYASIAPFFRLSGAEFLRIMDDAYAAPGTDVWFCQVDGAPAKTRCRHPFRGYDRDISSSINLVLQGITGVLPNVTFLVNHLDEPRIILPASGEISSGKMQIETSNLSQRSTFSELTKSCHWSTSIGQLQPGIPPPGLPFVNVTEAQNLCLHPEYANQHGLFLSPISLRPISGFVPVLSTGVPSTMGDIMFPSPAYTEPGFAYDSSKDPAWDDKRNNLYWAGSTTGGYAADDVIWRGFHRQRFVSLATGRWDAYSYLEETSTLSNSPETTPPMSTQVRRIFTTKTTSYLNPNLYKVSFTRFHPSACTPHTCRTQLSYFSSPPSSPSGTQAWADSSLPLQSKLVFDMDGNGISGRFYKLLASKSAVLKHVSVFREWHDDRLVPWVHYVPVSMGMEELPELVMWLTSTEMGKEMAREIGEMGSEWMKRGMREVDRGIYMYRLILELARLQDPKREAAMT